MVASNVLNVALEVLFVYGLGWGISGSAWGTVISQALMGLAFWVLVARGPGSWRPRWERMRPLLGMGGWIVLRTGALLGAFTVASAVLARVGPAALGAHQVAFSMFEFLALVLDAIAIAGQVIVGRTLGAGDAAGARDSARRMIELSLALGIVLGLALAALADPVPRLFTSDPAVLAAARELWPLFALMQPAAAVVFALDGILLGAGDARFLAGSMAVAGFGLYVPIALAALEFGWGIRGVWAGLLALVGARLLTNGLRFRSGRWAVTGTIAPA